MQKITFIGNLCSDPEVRSTPNGITVTTLVVAVDRKFKDAQGDKKTDFFRVVCWRQLGEICAKFLSKGKKVAVVGELQARTYEAKDGSGTRFNMEVRAEDVEFLSSRQDDQGAPAAGAPANAGNANAKENGFAEVDDDDLPF